MKRILLLSAISVASFGALPLPLTAQDDAARAAAIAEKQAVEQDHKRLNQDVADLLAAQTVLQKRLAELEREIRHLRDEDAKASNTFVTRDDLKRLAEQLKEIDQKREADKKLILEEFKKLVQVPATPPTEKKVTPPVNPTAVEKGYEYTIKKDDRLLEVIAVYNEEFKKQGKKPITLKHVMEANPNLKPNTMKVGQKVFIPAPEE